MPTLLPWSSVEIGDLDIFAPTVPSLFVYTWYPDDEPESTVAYFWQDEGTGLIRHELLFNAPVSYDEAIKWAQDHASKSDIKRIHVRHARSRLTRRSPVEKSVKAAKATRRRAKKGAVTKRKIAKAGKRARKSR